MSKNNIIRCDFCGAELNHPALVDVKLKYRANTGYGARGLGKGRSVDDHPAKVMGYVEVEISGDFCNTRCLRLYAHREAVAKDSSVLKVSQGIS